MPAEYRPSLRSIQITHVDGMQSTVDLLRYYATGERTENPYLLDGDIINVPSYHEDRTSVRVDGPVPFAGIYPYREGDRLSDILIIANGSTDLGNVEEVRVTTRTTNGPTTVTVSASEVSWERRIGTAQDPILAPGDFVRISEEELESAGLFGWVQYPATYPIVSGKTTIADLIRMGGGLRPDADIGLAYVERYQPTIRKGDAGTSDLDFFSRTFFNRTKSATRLHVDVAAILRGEADDYYLEHGDAVVFPRAEDVVFVVGNVVQGGYVPFVEGRPASYYVELSGGFAPLSRDVYVYDPSTGQATKGPGATVLAGSTIYVDREGFAETPELQSLLVTERTSRRQLRLASTQTIISGITAITAIVTTVIAITR
jgi:protein involved in polysaccharide export with SLBB domain